MAQSLFFSKKIIVVLSLFIVLAAGVRAQKPVSVNGKATFELNDNDNITLMEAKIKCIENAKIEALKKEFGTIVVSDDVASEKEVNNSFTSYYLSEVSSSVKGQWLADEREPEINIEYIDGKLIFTVEVWGKAREVVRANTDIQWRIQRDVGGVKLDSDKFDSGERFFISVKSPADGYIAIYLLDSGNETACLLPYRKDNAGRYRIKGGKEYLFFDKATDPNATYYKFNTNLLQEHNQLVMIYSPNPFTKCTDMNVDPRHPNVINQVDFAKWLLKNQRADIEMVIERRWVVINGTIDNK